MLSTVTTDDLKFTGGHGISSFDVTSTGVVDLDVVYQYSALGDSIPGAVPESSTWAMMLLGFGGLGVAGYRSSRKRKVAEA